MTSLALSLPNSGKYRAEGRGGARRAMGKGKEGRKNREEREAEREGVGGRWYRGV